MANTGKIIEPAGANIWDHERRTARALAAAGITVEFIIVDGRDHIQTADVLIEGLVYEMKSPKTDKLRQLQNNIIRANKKSRNIIIDSQRMKNIPDAKIQAYLLERFKRTKSIDNLVFVNRKREVIDIKTLVK